MLCVEFSDAPLVYEDMSEASKMMKKVRESRFKAFKTYDEALRFAKCGLESPTEIEIPIVISAELNGNLIQNGYNNGNCDKNATKGNYRNEFYLCKFAERVNQ